MVRYGSMDFRREKDNFVILARWKTEIFWLKVEENQGSNQNTQGYNWECKRLGLFKFTLAKGAALESFFTGHSKIT